MLEVDDMAQGYDRPVATWHMVKQVLEVDDNMAQG